MDQSEAEGLQKKQLSQMEGEDTPFGQKAFSQCEGPNAVPSEKADRIAAN
ncbi:hypothetical protein DSLASN_02880 [Desulfoluna limicola]|uniref:Uncharacterized protein n=1 Tax=Desulfoluna limicola TaxID=2810562 RepID=A0ABM7PAJ9_9BACT|nr:hypothetical protein DSLASN_02880 [Desulfoluna limicola]